MVFFAQKILRKLPGNWTFVVVTDRVELDDQIAKTFKACGAVTEAVLQGVRWLVGWPLLGGWKIYLSPLQTVGVALLCALPAFPGGTVRVWLTRGSLLAVALTLLCWSPSAPATLTVTALSVGQGDAFLLTRPDGRNYLIDGGGLHDPTALGAPRV